MIHVNLKSTTLVLHTHTPRLMQYDSGSIKQYVNQDNEHHAPIQSSSWTEPRFLSLGRVASFELSE